MRSSIALLLLAVVSCASDKSIVANAAAAYIYYEDAYEQRCVDVVGPKTCVQYAALLVQARRQTQLANKVYVIGKLPKAERAELKDLVRQLEALPTTDRAVFNAIVKQIEGMK